MTFMHLLRVCVQHVLTDLNALLANASAELSSRLNYGQLVSLHFDRMTLRLIDVHVTSKIQTGLEGIRLTRNQLVQLTLDRLMLLLKLLVLAAQGPPFLHIRHVLADDRIKAVLL